MARIASAVKLGFYPLPEEHGPSLRVRLKFPPANTPATALDPCAGTGAALRAITSESGSRLYAVELDANRAEAVRESGIETIQGSVFDVRAKAGRLSLLYLNPPYDFEIGPYANKRMESLFLSHTYGWLKPKGVLIMAVPGRAISGMAPTLAARFENVRIYRMEGELSQKYDQYAVFGVRHNNVGRAEDQIQRQIIDAMWRTGLLPVLTPEADAVYSVPPGGEVEIVYRGIPLDAAENLLPMSAAWRHASPLLLPKADIVGGRPLTPLHGGHVGLLATAGMLNGVFGEGDRRHLARWKAIKHSLTAVETKDGVTVERTTERFSNELALVFASGETQILTETKRAAEEPEEAPAAESANLAFKNQEDEKDEIEDEPVTPQRLTVHFDLGELTVTQAVLNLVAKFGLDFSRLVKRHSDCDWGDSLDWRDWRANDKAVVSGNLRIFSSYSVPEAPGGEIWVVTKADHSETAVFLPGEYPDWNAASTTPESTLRCA